MNKKNIINEFVLEFNGKRYVPRHEHDIPYDGHVMIFVDFIQIHSTTSIVIVKELKSPG